MWAFTATIYTYTIPFLFCLSFAGKGSVKKISLHIIAAINPVLIFYALWMMGLFWNTIAWALQWKNTDIAVTWGTGLNIEWLVIAFLKLTIPFTFLYKRNAFSKWLTVLMWSVVNYFAIGDFVQSVLYKIPWNTFASIYIPYALFNKIAFFMSAAVFFYALFWILKKLPFSYAEKR